MSTPATQATYTVGPYRLIGQIGEGGMGVVYLARAPDDSRVAVKVLRPYVVGDARGRARLAREVTSLRRVHSPRIAEVYDADPWGETPYVVTRYVPGPSLREVVEREGKVEGRRLTRLARGLAEALVVVHGADVLHRDVKPSNVLMHEGDPVLIDFGLAQLSDDATLTQTGFLLGTPGYLAPEILYGDPPAPAADVHAWAATVVYAATGHGPYGSGPAMAVMDRARRGEANLTGVPAELVGMRGGGPASRPGRPADSPHAPRVARRGGGTRGGDHAEPGGIPRPPSHQSASSRTCSGGCACTRTGARTRPPGGGRCRAHAWSPAAGRVLVVPVPARRRGHRRGSPRDRDMGAVRGMGAAHARARDPCGACLAGCAWASTGGCHEGTPAGSLVRGSHDGRRARQRGVPRGVRRRIRGAREVRPFPGRDVFPRGGGRGRRPGRVARPVQPGRASRWAFRLVQPAVVRVHRRHRRCHAARLGIRSASPSSRSRGRPTFRSPPADHELERSARVERTSVRSQVSTRRARRPEARAANARWALTYSALPAGVSIAIGARPSDVRSYGAALISTTLTSRASSKQSATELGRREGSEVVGPLVTVHGRVQAAGLFVFRLRRSRRRDGVARPCFGGEEAEGVVVGARDAVTVYDGVRGS